LPSFIRAERVARIINDNIFAPVLPAVDMIHLGHWAAIQTLISHQQISNPISAKIKD
jgi:hypothetical protein